MNAVLASMTAGRMPSYGKVKRLAHSLKGFDEQANLQKYAEELAALIKLGQVIPDNMKTYEKYKLTQPLHESELDAGSLLDL